MPMPLAAIVHNVVPIFGDPSAAGRTFKIVILSEGFTRAELATQTFASAAKEVAERVVAESPFRHLLDRIAIIRVDCESNTSAVALLPLQPPPAGYLDSTPFSAVWDTQTKRIIVGDAGAAKALVRLHPELSSAQAILAIVNNPNRGGATRDGVGWTTTSGDFASVFIHELGHSAFGLADEYDYTTGADGEIPQIYLGSEPMAPNVTVSPNANLIPWHDLVTINVPLPTTVTQPPGSCDFNHPVQSDAPDDAVGAFEGGSEKACGIFRPAFRCLMRDGLPPFCPVCGRAAYARIAGLLQAGKPLKNATIGTWTHVVGISPFTTTFNQVFNYLVAYNAGTGALGLFLGSKLDLLPTDATLMVDAFWSTLTPFVVGGEQFLMFANFASNQRAIYRIDLVLVGNPSAPIFTKVWDSNSAPERGYTHIVACSLEGASHVLSYDSLSGDVLLERMDSDGTQGVKLSIVASSRLGSSKAWSPGWSGVVVTNLAGESLVVANAAVTGIVWVARLQVPGEGASPPIATDRFLSPAGFMPGIRTHLAAVSPNGQPMVFSYSAFDGYGYFYRLRKQGKGMDYQRSLSLGLGGLSVLGFGAPALGSFTEIGTDTFASAGSFFWFYNAALSAIRLGQFA